MNRQLVTLALLAIGAIAVPKAAAEARTTVIVLGVDHAAQLVSSDDSPATLAAFLARAKPDAICIERSPAAFARNDYYEFTYEVQDIVVPYARQQGIDLCPMDWEPSTEDAKLGFGMDLEAVPELRPAQGFQQFLSFPQPAQLQRDLFHADNPKNLERITQWIATPAKQAQNDLPRRLYLYRTYLQAKRVAAAAKAHAGGTVLVVVGEFHKQDIESILASDQNIALVQPSSLGKPSDEEISKQDRTQYRLAIASFNLLGIQAQSGNIDLAFVRSALQPLIDQQGSPEVALLSTRLDLVEGRISRSEAIKRYRQVANDAGVQQFTWTGAKDKTRIDSYFDPFGNLSIRQRALLEAARELQREGDIDAAEKIRIELNDQLTERKQVQLSGYWKRYVAPPVGPPDKKTTNSGSGL